ncbi:MAG TPA: hypothetical protein VNE58_04670 [Casimicrobiaceae bacterium]|nr:hypothetical protein [Casimicrobiaceae bacterium]
MPTARELLEQADALMRRNRGGGEAVPRDVQSTGPVTFTTSPYYSPRTIQREPIAPSVARTSLPVDPTDAPSLRVPLAPPSAPDDVAPAASSTSDGHADDEFPLLIDSVESPPSYKPSIDAVDDVPLLMDAVEEIDVGIVEEGDESIWDLTAQGEASVLREAHESVPANVKQVADAAPKPVSSDPLGLDRPAQGFESNATAMPADDDSAEVPPDVEAPRNEESAESRAVAPSPVVESRDEATREADDARIRAIAEELGMQLLQRIDIFSDTTLRAQLAQRLRPLVERTSADLVAAINQHVGELLHVYIAEAIEREIEEWRKRNGDEGAS